MTICDAFHTAKTGVEVKFDKGEANRFMLKIHDELQDLDSLLLGDGR